MNFDDRLRSALAHDPPPAVPPGFVNGIIVALPETRRGPWPRFWRGPVAVAVVIVVAVGVWLVGPRGFVSGPPAETASGTPAASSRTSVLAPTATPGLSAWTHLGWRDASPAFGGTSASAGIVAGTSWSGGYVLVGETGPLGADGAIWYSADGTAWQRGVDSHGGAFEGMRFVGVAATGGRLVAVAFEGALKPAPEAVVWISTDGAVWFPSSDADALFSGLSIAGIAGGPDGFVVYGTTQFGQPTRPAMLYSSDGATWTEAVVPNGVVGEAVTSVVGTADGFAAVGGPVGSAVGTGVAGAAWWSLDGQTWHPATVDSGDSLYGVVRWAGGELRASSSTQTCCVSLGMPEITTWSSSDGGRSWRPLGNSVVLSHQDGDTTIYDAGRLVRLQTDGSPWATWSSDGVTWTPLRMDGTSPISASPCHASPCRALYLIVANGNTLIATGWVQHGGGSLAEVLVGQLDDQPGPVPTPTLVPGSQDTPCKGTNPCGP